MKTAQAAGVVVIAIALGLVAWCCGPKFSPPDAYPSCPGEKFEVCEHDKLGAHNCYCPE